MSDLPRRNLPRYVVGKSIPATNVRIPNIELSTIRDLRAAVRHEPSEQLSTIRDLRRLWNLSPMLLHLSRGRLPRRQPVSSRLLTSCKLSLSLVPWYSVCKHISLFQIWCLHPKVLEGNHPGLFRCCHLPKMLRFKDSGLRRHHDLETF